MNKKGLKMKILKKLFRKKTKVYIDIEEGNLKLDKINFRLTIKTEERLRNLYKDNKFKMVEKENFRQDLYNSLIDNDIEVIKSILFSAQNEFKELSEFNLYFDKLKEMNKLDLISGITILWYKYLINLNFPLKTKGGVINEMLQKKTEILLNTLKTLKSTTV